MFVWSIGWSHYVAQAGCKLMGFSCLSLLTSGMTGMCPAPSLLNIFPGCRGLGAMVRCWTCASFWLRLVAGHPHHRMCPLCGPQPPLPRILEPLVSADALPCPLLPPALQRPPAFCVVSSLPLTSALHCQCQAPQCLPLHRQLQALPAPSLAGPPPPLGPPLELPWGLPFRLDPSNSALPWPSSEWKASTGSHPASEIIDTCLLSVRAFLF